MKVNRKAVAVLSATALAAAIALGSVGAANAYSYDHYNGINWCQPPSLNPYLQDNGPGDVELDITQDVYTYFDSYSNGSTAKTVTYTAPSNIHWADTGIIYYNDTPNTQYHWSCH